MKRSAIITLIFHIILKDCNSSLAGNIANTPDECLTNSLESSLYCRGSRAINNIINNLSKTDKPIVIVRGLEIVPSNNTATTIKSDSDTNSNSDTDTGIGITENGADYSNDNTTNLLERFSRYLQTHELNIKFSDLMSSQDDESLLTRELEHSRMQINNDNSASSSGGDSGKCD